MSIVLNAGPDPGTEGAKLRSPVIMESRGLGLLLHELRRYRDNGVRGRSFLIAGHRGAGKTTLVNAAVHLLGHDDVGGSGRRPLVISIPGPNLFQWHRVEDPDAEPSTTNGQDDAESSEIVDSRGRPAKSVPTEGAAMSGRVRLALQQIILSLYRELVSEVARCYRERVIQAGQDGDRPYSRADMLERAAQLELELDEYPSAKRLREFWDAGQFLDRGVLFPAGTRGEVDQGLRELVAVSSACEAYRRISGTFQQAKQTEKAAAGEHQKATVGTGDQGRDLLTPLLSLFTGGLAGTGVGLASGAVSTGTITGIAAALASAFVFNYTSSRGRKRSVTQEYTFLPDLSVATLDRALPVLIRRLHGAGLVPVFVVDELDKVDNLYDELFDIVRHLKTLVAERAFFCFLTDRSYFERVALRSIRDPYPKYYTYFTDHVFVAFTAREMHQYLERIVIVDDGDGAPEQLKRERADAGVLPYVIMRRAEMHAIDVRRELGKLRGREGALTLEDGMIRGRAGRLDLLVQVAIRTIVESEEVEARIARDPAFIRLVNDALYYPVRLRDRGRHELHGVGNGADGGGTSRLDLRDRGLTEFRQYLVNRMSSDADASRGVPELTRGELAERDVAFLYQHVRQLAAMLADPFQLWNAVADWEERTGVEIPQNVVEALPLAFSAGPLLSWVPLRAHSYLWRYDRDGDPISTGKWRSAPPALDLRYRLAVRIVRNAATSNGAPLPAGLDRALWRPYVRWAAGRHDLDLDRLSIPSPCRRHVRLLADLLSDYDAFEVHLSALGWREKFAPVLSQVAGFDREGLQLLRTERFHAWAFNYDIAGRPAAGADGAVWLGLQREWEDNTHLVLAVLEGLAGVSDGLVSFAELAGTYNLLPVTPDWGEAEPAVSRLSSYIQTRTPYDGLDADKQVVNDFATMLSARGDAMAFGVTCGFAVGRASGWDDAKSALHHGLGTLDAAFGFGDRGSEPPGVRLKSLAEEIASRLEGLPLDAPELGPTSYDAWTKWLLAVPGAIEGAIPDPPAFADGLEDRAWDAWHAYFQGAPDDDGAGFVPGFDALAAAAAQRGPGQHLPFDLTALSRADWSRLVHDALAGVITTSEEEPVPLWMTVPALRELGLPPNEEAFPDAFWSGLPIPPDDLPRTRERTESLLRPGPRPAAGALVLVESANSPAAGWPESEQVPFLVWTAEQADALVSAWPAVAGLPFLPTELTVVAEESVSEPASLIVAGLANLRSGRPGGGSVDGPLSFDRHTESVDDLFHEEVPLTSTDVLPDPWPESLRRGVILTGTVGAERARGLAGIVARLLRLPPARSGVPVTVRLDARPDGAGIDVDIQRGGASGRFSVVAGRIRGRRRWIGAAEVRRVGPRLVLVPEPGSLVTVHADPIPIGAREWRFRVWWSAGPLGRLASAEGELFLREDMKTMQQSSGETQRPPGAESVKSSAS